MQQQPPETVRLEAVVRALATASKALRLYPASSPIPRQSVEAAAAAIEAFFEAGEPILSLTVVREGFSWRGQPVLASIAGLSELASVLREHGVAELDITPGVTPDELLAFLEVAGRDPDGVRAEGGLGVLTAAAGVEGVRVVDVQLTVVEQVGPAPDQDVEEFLRQLAADPEKLAAWFAAASAGDPAAFKESLMELVRVSGPSGYNTLLDSLSQAFMQQSSEGKDALLGLAMDPGPTRDLAGGMFGLMASSDIAGSVLGGTFGKNMLSLSSALTSLPLEQCTEQVRAEVQAMLPGTGHTPKEAQFLEHMLDVRGRAEPEPPLVDADRTYRAVAEAVAMPDEMIARARNAVAGSQGALNAASVKTMLSLLDQQRDFELYCAGADNLAAMVPRLVDGGDLPLAAQVVRELATRQAANTGPWPELSFRLRESLFKAVGPRTMGALVRAVIADPASLAQAREIVRYAGEQCGPALVTEAIALKSDGIAAAEQLIGRQIVDLLAGTAAQAQWYQLAPIAQRLAIENDQRGAAALDALMKRPDEQSRREVATGLAAAGTPLAMRMLAAALRDPSPEVAVVAARAIGRSNAPGAGAVLAARLSELDVDNDDYLLAREIIAALARVPEPAAEEALNKLASRRALIKRGHYAEVQDLVAQALSFRGGGGR